MLDTASQNNNNNYKTNFKTLTIVKFLILWKMKMSQY